MTSGAGENVAPSSPVVVGEVRDTHNPHLPGRVLVRWLDVENHEQEAWLQHERHLSLRSGDRVLLTLPIGWLEWLVTGVLGPDREKRQEHDSAGPTLTLEPGQALNVVSHQGVMLLRIRQGEDGPVLELGSDHVELKAARTLRLTADTVEIAAGQGGVDLRAEGDAVVRARTIRLN